jgi:hypothetical protein
VVDRDVLAAERVMSKSVDDDKGTVNEELVDLGTPLNDTTSARLSDPVERVLLLVIDVFSGDDESVGVRESTTSRDTVELVAAALMERLGESDVKDML